MQLLKTEPWLMSFSFCKKNAGEFPKAVPMDGIPAAIGDGYAEGIFYRAGEQIKGLAEMVLEKRRLQSPL